MKKESPSYLSKHDLYRKGNPARMMRVIAKGIDVMIAFLIAFVLYPWGILLGVLFLSIIDAANYGESIGKRIMGFRVVSLKDGSPCQIKASFIRNLPLTVPFFCLIVPGLGWVLFIFLIIPLVAMEIYLIFKLDSFHRLGDVLADTTVVANDPHREDLQKKQKDWAQPSDAFTRTHHGQ
ncbi:MAG: RDD family protein [Bacteriovoracaceae bacterium]|nr:RDD family protein [Bacteriovoracaceae bacterium]